MEPIQTARRLLYLAPGARRLMVRPWGSANSDRLSVILPTMDSSHYIDLILGYYQTIGVPTIVFVDAKSKDGTSAVAERFTQVIRIENPGTIAEEVAQQMSLAPESEFVLRMDDDELPSIGMIEFVKKKIAEKTEAEAEAYGFPRHQCAISLDGRLLRHLDHSATTDHRQWRLYRPREVRFTKQIHTSGFETNDLRLSEAPESACMIHLDWALHSYDQRKAKIQRYDAHTPGAGSCFNPYYLFEDAPGAKERFEPFDLPEFRSIARTISERFRDFCIR
jgi:glycosyltransferase involved in cell wall biosynthesis